MQVGNLKLLWEIGYEFIEQLKTPTEYGLASVFC